MSKLTKRAKCSKKIANRYRYMNGRTDPNNRKTIHITGESLKFKTCHYVKKKKRLESGFLGYLRNIPFENLKGRTDGQNQI